MENLIWLVPVIAVIALAYAIVLTQVIKKKEIGTDRMKEISGAIKEGAQAFLFAEYKILVIFIVVLFVLIGLFTGSDGIATGWMTAVCFLIGAIFSIIAGYIGIQDLTKGGDIIRSRTYSAFMPLIAAALIYLVLVMVFTFFVQKLERRLRNSDH